MVQIVEAALATPSGANLPDSALIVAEKKVGVLEQLSQQDWLRRCLVFVSLALAWELYAQWLGNGLLFPTFHETIRALLQATLSGTLLLRAWYSIKILLVGYAIGAALALLFTALAISNRIARDYLTTLTSMFNPLPSIALLPIALLWFGLGMGSVVFVLIHSVLWPLALNFHAGFESVPTVLRMVGRNYGLSGRRYVVQILIPAAFPSILAGLKIGWAFAWRTLLAAELIFGVNSGGGGIGWFIYESKNQLEIPDVFAGLLAIIIIGLLVDNLVFRLIENRTVRRWGTQS
jgi:sulfonate transport system permease protein